MGRHRPDPRGHARILVAALAVVLALALLIVGAIALFSAMTSKPDGRGATVGSSPAVSAGKVASSGEASGRPTAVHALLIKVTGPSAYVQVATAANTTVLQKGTLNHNEFRVYDNPDLIVTVDPAQYVDVEIHGKPVSNDTTGKQTWTVGQG